MNENLVLCMWFQNDLNIGMYYDFTSGCVLASRGFVLEGVRKGQKKRLKHLKT